MGEAMQGVGAEQPVGARRATKLGAAVLVFAVLLGCRSANIEVALPPATPISTQIQRLDDPTQAAIAYSSKTVYQKGPEVLGADSTVPPDRIGWTLLGLQDRMTGVKRYRLTLAMTYDNEEVAGYRNYDKASILPNGPALAVQPFSRKRSHCGGLVNDFCIGNEVIFAWMEEATLRGIGPEGMTVQVSGEEGRIWEFNVPQSLIAALFQRMDSASAS